MIDKLGLVGEDCAMNRVVTHLKNQDGDLTGERQASLAILASLALLNLGSVIWAIYPIVPEELGLGSLLFLIWPMAPFVGLALLSTLFGAGSLINAGCGLACGLANVAFWYFMYVAEPDGLSFLFVPFVHWFLFGIMLLLCMALENAVTQTE